MPPLETYLRELSEIHHSGAGVKETSYYPLGAIFPRACGGYTIGGYQVIKKWLSYREEKLLGRPITQDEAREVRDMARRIAAIILLEPELDANYERVKAGTWAWSQATPRAKM